MAVHSAISLGLDFSPGMALAREVRRLGLISVHPFKESGHFSMVVSFGRSSFRLDEDSVSLALEAATGGFCNDLKVSAIRDRVFSFTVSSKQVGFLLVARKFYSCPQFKCYYHLWGFGGPNWRRELSIWQHECAGEWILANRRSRSLVTRQRQKPYRPLAHPLRLANPSSSSSADLPTPGSPAVPPSPAPSPTVPLIRFGSLPCTPLQLSVIPAVVPADHAHVDISNSNSTSVAASPTRRSPSHDGLVAVIQEMAWAFWDCQ